MATMPEPVDPDTTESAASIIVGVTGHRDLRAQDLPQLTIAVAAILQQLRNDYAGAPLVVISPLAEGADRLVARVALEQGARLIVPLPFSLPEYEKDFATQESRDDFDNLLKQAWQCFELPLMEGNTATNIQDYGPERTKQYAQVGAYVAGHCHILIALWDGEGTGLEGGTWQIVDFKLNGIPAPYASKGQALDTVNNGPVYQIVTPREKNAQPRRTPFSLEVRLPEEWKGSIRSMRLGSVDKELWTREKPNISMSADDVPSPSDVSASPQPYDDDVMFTAYRPRTVVPEKWYSLLAFAHLSERRPDAPADEPDPIAEVQRQAQQIIGEQLVNYRQSTQQSSSTVPRAGEITFKPFIEGVEFNPSTRSFRWEESVHREEFKLRASTALDGQAARGWLRVYLGPLILAQINLTINVDSKHVSTSDKQLAAAESARPLRKVFASYSHRDRSVVEQIEKTVHQAHLGVQYLRDATRLRAGEEWNESLMRMIDEADMFQLFWSTNSMSSAFVRQEYEYALSLGKRHFVLPVYWETPFPQKPEENLPPEELLRLHFEKLNESTADLLEDAADFVSEQPSGAANPNTMEMAVPTEMSGPTNPVVFDAPPTGELVYPRGTFNTDSDITSACPRCAAQVPQLARFCMRCGASLQAAEWQSSTSARPAAALDSYEEPVRYERAYPTLASPTVPTTGSLPSPPVFASAPQNFGSPVPRKSSSTATIGLVVAGLAFVMLIPLAALAWLGLGLGASGPQVGNGSGLPLLLLLLFLFVIVVVLFAGGIVFFLAKRARR